MQESTGDIYDFNLGKTFRQHGLYTNISALWGLESKLFLNYLPVYTKGIYPEIILIFK